MGRLTIVGDLMEDQKARSSFTAEDFKSVMSLSPTPVTIVTANGDDGPQGIVIGSFVSVSLEPPLIGFFVGRTTRMWEPMAQAAGYCVNVLAEDQAALSTLFAGDWADRFKEAEWKAVGNGAPGLSGAVAWIEAAPYSVTAAGDHNLILLEVTALTPIRDTGPLVYHRGRYAAVSPWRPTE